jgi:hypothetical protein
VVHRWICGEATPTPERGEPGGEVWN